MHKSLKTFTLAGSALALAMTPALASAQDTMPGTTPPTAPQTTPPSMPNTGTTTPPTAPTTSPSDMPAESYPDTAETADTATPPMGQTMTPEQQQAAMASWPTETQTYYQSLTEDRQKMFWALSDTDKVRLSQLPEEQREVAWGQIEAQVKSQG